jgi:hypothetical protein
MVEVNAVKILVRSVTGQYDDNGRVEVHFPPARTLAIAVDDQ